MVSLDNLVITVEINYSPPHQFNHPIKVFWKLRKKTFQMVSSKFIDGPRLKNESTEVLTLGGCWQKSYTVVSGVHGSMYELAKQQVIGAK